MRHAARPMPTDPFGTGPLTIFRPLNDAQVGAKTRPSVGILLASALRGAPYRVRSEPSKTCICAGQRRRTGIEPARRPEAVSSVLKTVGPTRNPDASQRNPSVLACEVAIPSLPWSHVPCALQPDLQPKSGCFGHDAASPRMWLASVWAVCSSAAGSTWAYVSKVKPTDAWPSRCEITFTSCHPLALRSPTVA